MSFNYRICGPFAVLMAYLCECHSIKYRSRVMMALGIFFSISNIFISGKYIFKLKIITIYRILNFLIIFTGLAWLVIPQSWELSITNYSFGMYIHIFLTFKMF